MISISFDNPYLLLLAIPLLALVLVPYFLAIRKSNSSKSTVASLVIHTLMVALVSLAIAGVHQTTIKTKTEVIVVADLSHSASDSVSLIDEHINNLYKEGNLPENASVGVVCFGKDFKTNTPLGEKFVSVKNTRVDASGTDISGALEFASKQFSGDTIKRIVLITDGKQNTSGGEDGLVNSIKTMSAKNIAVDAIYLDSNLKQGDKEVQLTSVRYLSFVHLNSEAYVEAYIQSNTDYVYSPSNPKDVNDAYIRLYDGEGNEVKTVTRQLQKGFNIVKIKLDTTVGGIKDYRVVVEANHDTSKYNNEHTFTQKVAEQKDVLLISKTQSDLEKAQLLFGDTANIYAPLLEKKPKAVPYSLEELCKFDEFIISGVDVKTIENSSAFISNLDIAVSKFGKSFITAGNTYSQGTDDMVYNALEDMLAVKFGNDINDPKLYAIVIDSSRSMQDASQLIMAKETAIQLLHLMSPTDYVMVISFSGEVSIVQRATPASYKDEIIATINDIKPTQGTVLGAGLRVAYEQMVGQPFYQKQVMLISDGRSYASVNESDDAATVTADLYKAGIYTSVVNTNSAVGEGLLTRIKNIGRGEYYFIRYPEEVKDVVSTDISDDLTETVVEKNTPVIIEDYADPMVEGISSLPSIGGYYFNKVKPGAKIVLSVDYKKPSGSVVSVPIYSYWSYGNGRVATLATSFSGGWVSAYDSDEGGKELYRRLVADSITGEKITTPFNTKVTYLGDKALIEIIPGELNPDVYVDITVTSPSGEKLNNILYYDSGRYWMEMDINETGKHLVEVKYIYGRDSFDAELFFDIPYISEYDEFQLYDSSILYAAVANQGSVIEKGELKVELDEGQEEKYIYYFTVPLMIAAVVLFVIDVFVRKIKWSDIKSLFKKKEAGGKAQ